MNSLNNQRNARLYFSIFIIVICILYPLYHYVNSVYAWHIRQPEVWQGIIVFVASLGLALYLGNRDRGGNLLFSAVIWILYLCYNGVVIPFFLSAFYLLGICIIGMAIRSQGFSTLFDIPAIFISGLSVWIAGAVICSLMGIGTINDLRILTVVLYIIAFIILMKRKWKKAIMGESVTKCIVELKTSYTYIVICALFVLGYFAARTNNYPDIDSLWYGLRPEYVLVGVHSFYDYLGMNAYVHYYPKLVELLYLPLSALGDYSFILCGNICVLGLMGLGYFILICELTDDSFDNELKCCLSLMLVTIPAATSISLTAKPDIFGCCLTVYAMIHLVRFLKQRCGDDLGYGILALLICTGTKLTYLLWGGILLISFISAVLVLQIKSQKPLSFSKKISGGVWISALTNLIGIFGVHYRTYILTGYWIYPIGLSLQEKFLGCTAKNGMLSSASYMSRVSGGTHNIAEGAYRVFCSFFAPTTNSIGMDHMMIAYISPVVIVAFLLMLIFGNKNARYNERLKIFCALLAFVLPTISLYYIVTMPLPDGNYFIFPLSIAAILYICIVINQISMESTIRKVYWIFAISFLGMHIFLDSFTSWAWQYGTKSMDTEILETNFETSSILERNSQNNGFGKIYNLFQNGIDGRTIILTTLDAREVDYLGRVETKWEIENWSDMRSWDTMGQFTEYIDNTFVTGFMIEEGITDEMITQYLDQYGYDYALKDDNFTYYALNASD